MTFIADIREQVRRYLPRYLTSNGREENGISNVNRVSYDYVA